MKQKRYCLICSIFMFLFFCIIPINADMDQQSERPSPDIGVKNPAFEKGRGPVVLFDEGHNNFHKSRGTYKQFVDVIVSDGYVVHINKKKFTEEILKGHDVLVISNAMDKRNIENREPPHYPAFTIEEIGAVHEWVKRGGGLFLIADHEPWGAAAFDLARKFGVLLSKGTAVEPGDKDSFYTIFTFSREKGNLLDHPVTIGRNKDEKVNKVQTWTGESMKAPEGSGFLQLSEKAFDLDPVTKKKRAAPGPFQGAAFAYGSGIVVVLGEAAMFKVEYFGRDLPEEKLNKLRRIMTLPKPRGMIPNQNDNKKLLLNIMHYLSGLLEPGIVVSGESTDHS